MVFIICVIKNILNTYAKGAGCVCVCAATCRDHEMPWMHCRARTRDAKQALNRWRRDTRVLMHCMQDAHALHI